MPYHHASVYSAKLEDYVLKVHGQGWCDMYIQLPNLNAVNTWENCFNQKKPDYLDFRRKNTATTAIMEDGDNETTSKQGSTLQVVDPQQVLRSLDITTHHPHDTNATMMLESSMSQDHLLRRMSERSLEEEEEEDVGTSSTAVNTKNSSAASSSSSSVSAANRNNNHHS